MAVDRTSERAWAALFHRSWGFVLAIAFRELRGNTHLAEEVAQEVFIRLVRHCPFAELQMEEMFRGYLWRVTRNACLTRLKQEHGRQQLEAEAGRRHPTVTSTDRVELRDLFRWMLGHLDPADQKLIRMTAAGHGLGEIAGALGLSYGNAGVRRHRARGVMRKLLQEHGLAVGTRGP